MSIFKKKGTIESLFRIGAQDDEFGSGKAGHAKGDKDGKHEVYYVRGRPFIAPTKTGAHARTAAARSGACTRLTHGRALEAG